MPDHNDHSERDARKPRKREDSTDSTRIIADRLGSSLRGEAGVPAESVLRDIRRRLGLTTDR